MTTVFVVGVEHAFKWLLERLCLSHVSSCEAPALPYTPPCFLPTSDSHVYDVFLTDVGAGGKASV